VNTLIIPVYKNEESITDLLAAVTILYQKLANDLTVTFVIDGSPDTCHQLLQAALPAAVFPSKLIVHSRNFGSFAAIRTGLLQTEADFYAVMAADLQEPPGLILDFFKALASNSADLVLGARDGRKDPWSSRIFSELFWSFYRRYIIKELPRGGVDIFGCNRQVRDKVLEFGEARSSLIAQLMWVGFRRTVILYQRLPRLKGKSAWTFRKKVDYLMDSVFSFTDLPIKFLIKIGAFGAFTSFVVGVVVIASRLAGYTKVSGYTALMIAIVFFGAMNLLGLGIIGSYAQRGYENTKQRPLSIISNVQKFEGK
jgi:polyisoprenyl-phosphate glycosyltransferase